MSEPPPEPAIRAPRRRDRHGRGLRGVLLPVALPAAHTRAEAFDELVLVALHRLTGRWGSELAEVELVVEQVPPPGDVINASRAEPATATARAQIVVHRRVVESRVRSARAREALVYEVVVEAVADLLGLTPELVDPDRDPREPPDDELPG